MADAEKNTLFLRPGKALNARLAALAADFKMENRQEVVMSVLRDFLDGWEQLERQRRERNAAYVRGLVEKSGAGAPNETDGGGDEGEAFASEDELKDVHDHLAKEKRGSRRGPAPKAGRKRRR